MKEKENMLDPLLEKAEDFGKTSIELFKLKAIDKTSDIASTVVPYVVIVWSLSILILFLNLGLAFWLGSILGTLYLGFFVIAAFYGFLGILVHFILYNRLKERIRNAIIKKMLK